MNRLSMSTGRFLASGPTSGGGDLIATDKTGHLRRRQIAFDADRRDFRHIYGFTHGKHLVVLLSA